ncbi:hypothetical protein [Wolbachia endosymbiont (group A) of Anomoia purmunda]|uniref:hypothetical protein n=1 Tax=Wolbachia endosymbiont (group A) of Anomoia purmunda TaxID=2953978 RepID=UPI00222EA888|nr:hypothetical protein [Wolbachia endosymbiont (group A) of Anomoia purmunda]
MLPFLSSQCLTLESRKKEPGCQCLGTGMTPFLVEVVLKPQRTYNCSGVMSYLL